MTIRNRTTSPLAAGYRMPAEWEPQRATWLAWPHNRTDWPGKFAPIPFVYAEIVRHLARAARVELIVNDAQAEAATRTLLTNADCRPWSPASPFTSGPPIEDGCVTPAPSSSKTSRAKSRSPTGSSTAGPSTKTGNSITCFPKRSLRCAAARSSLPPSKSQGAASDGARRRIDRRQRRGLLLTTEECLLSPVQQRNPGCPANRSKRASR